MASQGTNDNLESKTPDPKAPAISSPSPPPLELSRSPSWTSEVVFKIQHGAQWEEMVKVASQNFHWKSHFVLEGDGTIFPFADEHGKLHGTPVEKNFPLHVVLGRCDLPGIEIVLSDSGKVEFFSLPDRLPDSQCVSPPGQTPIVPHEGLGNGESEASKQTPIPEPPTGEIPTPPAMVPPPSEEFKKGDGRDETAAAPPSVYEDGSYWKTLVCIELMIDNRMSLFAHPDLIFGLSKSPVVEFSPINPEVIRFCLIPAG